MAARLRPRTLLDEEELAALVVARPRGSARTRPAAETRDRRRCPGAGSCSRRRCTTGATASAASGRLRDSARGNRRALGGNSDFGLRTVRLPTKPVPPAVRRSAQAARRAPRAATGRPAAAARRSTCTRRRRTGSATCRSGCGIERPAGTAPASVWHSSGSRITGRCANPCASSDDVDSAQSTAARRSPIVSATAVIAAPPSRPSRLSCRPASRPPASCPPPSCPSCPPAPPA